MRVVIVGATGFTGSRLIAPCLDHGHAVTVLVRDPSRLRIVASLAIAALRCRAASGDPNATASESAPPPMNCEARSRRVSLKGTSARRSSGGSMSAGTGLGVASTTRPMSKKAAPSR